MKKKKVLLLMNFVVCMIVIPLTVLGQTSRIIGSTEDERANAIVTSLDPLNGYVMAGFTTSCGVGTPNAKNAVVVRTNSDGIPINSVVFGGSEDEEATSIIKTSDECYVVTGWTRSYNTLNYSDIFVIKFNPDLTVVWAKIYHLTPYDLDHQANCIIELSSAFNGGYGLTGFACGPTTGTKRIFVMRLDVNGNFNWARTYAYSNNLNNEGFGITEVFDGTAPSVKLAVVGHTSLDQGVVGDAFIMRMNSYGNTIGSTTVFNGNYEDYAQSVLWDGTCTTPGITVAGWTKSGGGGCPSYSNVWAARIKAIDGSVIWSNAYYWNGGIEHNDKILGDKSLIRITTDKPCSGYILAGLTYSRGPQAGNMPNVLLMCLNGSGSLGWGSMASVHPSFTLYNNYDEAYGVVEASAIPGLPAPGDGFTIAGWSNSYSSSTPPPDDKILLSAFAQNGTRPNGCANQYLMQYSPFSMVYSNIITYTNGVTIKDIEVTPCSMVSQEFCPGKI